MEAEPRGRGRKFTDAELRACVEQGKKPVEIATLFKCSQAAVSQRLKQLNLTTISAAVAPVESQRFVKQAIDVLGQLQQNLCRANLLQDACDAWLRDPNDLERYDIGPRAGDVDVIYVVEVTTATGFQIQKRKKSLEVLLACLEDGRDADGARFSGVEKVEYKHADPRELILKTHQETRASVALFADLIQKLTDAQVMADFRKIAIEEIGKESPDCARRIAERLQRSIVLHAAFSGPGAAGGVEVH